MRTVVILALALVMPSARAATSDDSAHKGHGGRAKAPVNRGMPTPAADYEVSAGPGARELRVEVLLRPSSGGFIFEEGQGRYARDVEAADAWGGPWKPAAVEDDALIAPACDHDYCRVRYRFLLAEAARNSRPRSAEFEQGGALVAPPSTWLVRPADRGVGFYILHVTTPPGLTFVTGLIPMVLGGTPILYRADLADLPEAPYSAFGPFTTEHVKVEGGEVEVAILPGEIGPDRAAIVRWVERAAGDIAAYYGRYPVPRALVIVIPGGRRAIGFGTTMGNGGASIMIWVGSGATTADLARDWVLTHEMSHLALPNLPRRQHWMEEGLATYVEPIARARRGHLSTEEVWSDLVRRTPQGVPGPGGLDASQGFGAIYWGGALFWLLADVEIRERTGERRSLEDALRGVRDAGGSIAVTWPVERVLATADRAAGLSVLQPLYDRLARSAGGVDLPSLWSRLGIEDTGVLRFRDDAPLAAIRRAITHDRPKTALFTPRP